MKLEVKYPDKPAHEVELTGTLAVVGRDPSCDLVVNDERCSRRHAVLELTPTGLQVRDAGSANGVFVNGKKRERSSLVPGDLVRIGEVMLKILPDGPAGTVVVAPDDIVGIGPPPGGPSRLGTEARPVSPGREAGMARREAGAERPAAQPERRPAAPAAAAGPRPRPRATAGPPRRPLTVTVLAGLWLASIFIYGGAALASRLLGLQDQAAMANTVVCAALALLSGLMAFGLLTLKPWARLLQAVLAGVGLLSCPFTLASATTLIYVLRPSTRAAFASGGREGWDDPSEMTFALTLLGTAALGAGLVAAAILAARFMG